MSRMPTDVSFIIVNWNTRELVLQCIASLFRCIDGTNAEVILVDNGSEDGTLDAVHKRYPAVHTIGNRENLGFACANNMGMATARGRYLCLVNSDIELISPIAPMIEWLDAHPTVGMLGPKTLNDDLTLRPNCRRFPTLWNTTCVALGTDRLFPRSRLFSGTLMTYFAHDEPRTVEVLPGCFLVVRRAAMKDVGPLDEGYFFYGEDLDWCRRFAIARWGVYFYPSVSAIHYAGMSSRKAPHRFLLMRLQARYRYWQKYHGPRAAKVFLAITLLHYGIRILGLSMRGVDHRKENGRHSPIGGDIACLRWAARRLSRGRIN